MLHLHWSVPIPERQDSIRLHSSIVFTALNKMKQACNMILYSWVVSFSIAVCFLKGGLGDRVVVTKSSAILTERSNATLPCRVFAQTEWVQWSKEKGISRELLIHLSKENRKIGPGYESGRFDMDESHSLEIMNVNQSDEGRYLCEIFESGTNLPFFNYTDVAVSGKPYLYIDGCSNQTNCNFTTSTEEEHVVFTCSIIGARGPISLYWRGEDSEDIISSVTTQSDSPLNYSVTMRETTDIIRTRKKVTCVAEAPNEYETMRANVVLYHPTNGYASNTSSCVVSLYKWSTSRGGLIAAIFACIFFIILLESVVYFIWLVKKRRREQDNVCTTGNGEDQPMIETNAGVHSRTNFNRQSMQGVTPSDGHAHSQKYSDPVYGLIDMPPYCQMIIETPEFQRLHFIKQLGTAYFVYPGATQSRFLHSIGVSHLAGVLINHLRSGSSIKISDVDIACVHIAGLCQDLGHLPFGHEFERLIAEDPNRQWTREDAAVEMFKHLIEKNKLVKKLQRYGLKGLQFDFICDLILGRSNHPIPDDRFFLYQIVNNQVTGIDVDKWDYMKRDSFYLGMPSSDIDRIFSYAKVVHVKGKSGSSRKEICYCDKVMDNINNLFADRLSLHTKVYKHIMTSAVSLMIIDALRNASLGLKYVAENGLEVALLDAVNSPTGLSHLNDGIMHEIMQSRYMSNGEADTGMGNAREIIERIQRAQLYQCIVEIKNAESRLRTIDKEEILNWIKEHMSDKSQQSDSTRFNQEIWRLENIALEVCNFSIGHRGKNPFLSIPFFSERDNETSKYLAPDEMPSLLPQTFHTVTLRIYTTVPADTYTVTKKDEDVFKERAEADHFWEIHDSSKTPAKGCSTVNVEIDDPQDEEKQHLDS